ncbi:oxygen-independent coproporphyrinogen III oxidase [Zavarzinia sp. CC-PAN008]|uniref:oxygen-independent coproporphyrinogen III oxidase n=1 Tax=Zavarzinia sp. CC-PAN008 TaxID=3243332 RepID=UPI003F74469D
MNTLPPPDLHPTLVELARRPVPRYTSYPTAPQFSAEVTPARHAAWLDEVGQAGQAISLYLHVPFCRALCHYCGCATQAVRRDAPVRTYVEGLHQEIALLAARLGRVEVAHLHWGGGTPNILPPDCFAGLMEDLAQRFRLRPDMEHAIELDPRHLTAEGARHLAAHGVTRASLGVQTLDPLVQEAIGRVQPLAVVRAAFDHLRDAGIAAINADLMYGLPRQTLDAVEATATALAALEPSRLAIFGYAHVPWMRPHQGLMPQAALPDAAERLRQAAMARAVIEDAGYREIGIDHFARADDPLALAQASGHLRRNFQGYTDDDATTLIGIGATAISRTPRGFAQNTADTPAWRRAVAAGQLPVVRGKAFDGDDRLRAEVIESLLCTFDADLAAIAGRHGATAACFADDLVRLDPLVAAGWVARTEARVTIRSHRHELARLVAAAFDAYLGQQGRHAAAV